MSRTVLVTGISRYLGGRLAALLAQDPSVDLVIGVDIVAPEKTVPGIEFVRADIRNPVMAKVLGEAGVDTVVHMGVIATPGQAGGRSTMKEINVIGTMQLLAACQQTPSVQSVVVKSTAAVYGSGPKDPAMFTEDMEPRHAPTSGWAKDSMEVESYVRGFARRRPDVTVTTLRFANFMGPNVDTSLTTYFSLPVVPTVLGYDPRLQFIHEDDGLEAIRRAVHARTPGTFNVAGDGVVTLSQAIRRVGRPSVAILSPLYATVGRTLSPRGLADFSKEGVRYLTYGRALDTGAMRRVLGFTPAHTSEEALMAFAGRRRHQDEAVAVA